MSPAPWAPMVAPPLPARNDFRWNLCEHAFPAEDCPRHGVPTPDDLLLR